MNVISDFSLPTVGGGVWVNAWFEFQTVGNGRLLEGCTWNGTHLVAGCAYSEEGFSHLSDAGLRCLGKYPLSFFLQEGLPYEYEPGWKHFLVAKL